MPGYLVHVNANIKCIHTGDAKTAITDQFVKVSGQKIVTQLSKYVVSGCKLPPQSGGPCTAALWTSAAQFVKASGQPVLLDDEAKQAKCIPTSTALLAISNQTFVKGT
jgi:hypothetical protein